ncbi:MAG: hypothetical protein RR376_08575 [Janthinobacterium sp.]
MVRLQGRTDSARRHGPPQLRKSPNRMMIIGIAVHQKNCRRAPFYGRFFTAWKGTMTHRINRDRDIVLDIGDAKKVIGGDGWTN